MKRATRALNRPPGGRVTVVGNGAAFFIAAAEALELGGYEVTCLVLASDVAARIVQTQPDLVCVEAPAPGEDVAIRIGAHWSVDEPELTTIPILVGTSDGDWIRSGGRRAQRVVDDVPAGKLGFDRLLDQAGRIVRR